MEILSFQITSVKVLWWVRSQRMYHLHYLSAESKLNLTNEEMIAIIPNCPNNKEAVNKGEQSGHFRF